MVNTCCKNSNLSHSKQHKSTPKQILRQNKFNKIKQHINSQKHNETDSSLEITIRSQTINIMIKYETMVISLLLVWVPFFVGALFKTWALIPSLVVVYKVFLFLAPLTDFFFFFLLLFIVERTFSFWSKKKLMLFSSCYRFLNLGPCLLHFLQVTFVFSIVN